MSALTAVRFEPSGSTVWVEPGTTVAEAAAMCGLVVPAPCGGRGICGACAIRVLEGELDAPDEIEYRGLARAGAGLRLACRAKVVGPVTLRAVIAHPKPSVSRAESTGRLIAGVDLGTTSVAAAAVEVASRREVGRASVPNRQQARGADVLTRLSAALEGSAEELRRLAEDSVLDALRLATGGAPERVERLVIAGNSVMAALVSGVDASSLAHHPFDAPDVPALLPAESPIVSAIAPGGEVRVVASIASFVGGDALAGLVAAGLLYSPEPMMLVDVGTNAEIVLAAHGKLWVSSAAAGPAFEGVGIRCGGPAGEGAVTRVSLRGTDIEFEAIGDAPAAWFSGAGLLSAVAMLRRLGHITAEGLMVPFGPLAGRMEPDEAGVMTVRLGEEPGCLVIDQRDVRAVQLAKAAIAVGARTVLRSAGLASADLSKVLVSGAFGSALDSSDVVELGMLPRVGSISAAGNTALAGSIAIALDEELEVRAREEAAAAIRVELASDPGFNEALIRALALEPAAD